MKNRILRRFIKCIDKSEIPSKFKPKLFTKTELLKLKPGDEIHLYKDFNPSNYTISDGIAHYKVAGWRKYRNGNHLLVISDGKKYRLDGVQAGKRNSNCISILIKY